ncbi:MAG: hypothetical protein QOG46_2707, partial [Pseudonocardiales bacterium]|nr:hypothetical protein [Pseudonocardiales bacterium]
HAMNASAPRARLISSKRRRTFKPLPFDAAAARAFGRVAASLRQGGRKPAARSYDALIAATALANDLPVYAANPHDFEEIDGLQVVAVEAPPAEP